MKIIIKHAVKKNTFAQLDIGNVFTFAKGPAKQALFLKTTNEQHPCINIMWLKDAEKQAAGSRDAGVSGSMQQTISVKLIGTIESVEY